MRKINTITELKAEQKRLRLKQLVLESEIKTEFAALKESFAPLKMLTKGVGNTLSSKDNGIIGNSFGGIAEFLVRNVVLRNSGFLTRLIVPYLAKNTASNIAENNKGEIVDWVTGLISKFSKRKTAEE